jgi:protein TonB
MFEDSLLEAHIKSRRKTATTISFVVQAIAVAVLVLIPLMFTQALPTRALVTTLVAPPPPPPPPPPAGSAPAVVHHEQVPVTSELTTPLKVPQKVAMVREEDSPANAAAPSMGGVVGGVPGGVAGGTIGGVVGGVLNSIGPPKLAAPDRVRVSSGVTQGLLLHKVTPQYPAAARTAGVQGTVVLAAVIGKDGKVQDVRVVSGPAVLTRAAVDAVRQWRYKPYYLNGQAVEVDTTINVNFKMG